MLPGSCPLQKDQNQDCIICIRDTTNQAWSACNFLQFFIGELQITPPVISNPAQLQKNSNLEKNSKAVFEHWKRGNLKELQH